MPSDAFAALGRYLTASEAETVAARLEQGHHVTTALSAVNPTRRDRAKQLFAAASLSHLDADRAVGTLKAIAGAKSVLRDVTPVWTMPGNEANIGRLTSEFHRLVAAARLSIVCATYNFEPTSQMWSVLKQASETPGVSVTTYIDGDKADGAKVKAQLPKATVYASALLPTGKRVVSHAKFIVIDRELLLITSANFSYSAENRNVEFGLLVQDSRLAETVESAMSSKHGTLYDLIIG